MIFLWNWVFTLVQVIGKADTWFLTTFLSWRPKSQIHSHMSEGHKRAFFPRKTILTVNRRANHGCRGRVKSSALLFNNVWAITETTRKEMPLDLNSLHFSYLTAFNVLQLFRIIHKIINSGFYKNYPAYCFDY